MKTRLVHASVLAAGVLLMSAPVVAHHGDAGRYDENPFIITGTIVEIKMTNPHSINNIYPKNSTKRLPHPEQSISCVPEPVGA